MFSGKATKVILWVSAMIIVFSLSIIITVEQLRKTGKGTVIAVRADTEKMVQIDHGRYPPSFYQTLLNEIQRECPGYSQKQIADMTAYVHIKLLEKGIKDDYFGTLYGMSEAVKGGVCREVRLEAVMASYVIFRSSQR